MATLSGESCNYSPYHDGQAVDKKVEIPDAKEEL